MRYNFDRALGGHSMAFDGPLDIAKGALESYKRMEKERPGSGRKTYWYESEAVELGQRALHTWEDVLRACTEPWEVGAKEVKRMMQEIDTQLDPPKIRRRTNKWNDEQGEVDVDRALKGEPNYMRAALRQVTHGPTHITLICGTVAFYASSNSWKEQLWRAAAALAVTDLLERSGYSVDVFMWEGGIGVFPHPYDKQFTTCKLKDAGEPGDLNVMIAGLSMWFLRTAVFGSYYTCPTRPNAGGWGSLREVGGWGKYIEINEGTIEIDFPIVYEEKLAIQAANDVIKQVNEAVSR